MLKLDRLLSDAHRAGFDALVIRPGTSLRAARRWLLDRNYAVGRDAVSAYANRLRGLDRPDRRTSKLDLMLKPEDRDEVDALVARPTTTVDSLHKHLAGKGYPVTRATVCRQMRVWRHELLVVKKSARFARSLAHVAADVGPGAFNGGAMLGFEQVILERVFDLRQREELGARELTEWATMLERVITVRDQMEKLRRRADEAARKANGPDGSGGAAGPPPRPVVNGVEIANCVRRILGVPLPGEPTPRPPALPPAAAPGAPRGWVSNPSTEHTEKET